MNQGTIEPRTCRFCGRTVGVITHYDDGSCTFTANEQLATVLDGAPSSDYRCKEHAQQPISR